MLGPCFAPHTWNNGVITTGIYLKERKREAIPSARTRLFPQRDAGARISRTPVAEEDRRAPHPAAPDPARRRAVGRAAAGGPGGDPADARRRVQAAPALLARRQAPAVHAHPQG